MLYQEKSPSFWQRFKRTKFFIYFIIVLCVCAAVFGSKVLLSSESITVITQNFFKNFLESEDQILQGEADGRINFLLLGVGGDKHEGAQLTDTIILGSLQLNPLRAAMISIPRDFLIFVDGYGYRKINSLNALKEMEEAGEGPAFLSQVLARTLNMPIHYYMKVDFKGVQNFIDEIGGVDIYVENSFTDYLYPTEDFLYQTVKFEKGWQTMNGDTLLKYVRSRHGNNGEAGDFSRGKRQQNAIAAVKNKLLNKDTWLNPKTIYSLMSNYKDNLNTNLEVWEILKLMTLAKNLQTQDIIKFGFSDDYNNYLQASNYQGAYVLTAKDKTYGEMQNVVANIFDEKVTEKASADILNGTEITGLAGKNKEKLQAKNFTIMVIGNAPKQDYQKTIIYNLAGEAKPISLQSLKDIYPQAEISTVLPFGIDTTADFVVILGPDANLSNSNESSPN
ncbi:MAG TPA: LCP family protein [bacterium]|nr:LCP family protein [bacterium]